jgi:hypothetical protein
MSHTGSSAKNTQDTLTSFLLIICLGFSISSCDDSLLGLDLLDEQNILNTSFTNELPIESSIVLLDSVPMTNISRVIVGQIDEPEIGKVQAEAYLLPSIGTETNVNFGQDARYNSLKLFLDPAYLYGDTTDRKSVV